MVPFSAHMTIKRVFAQPAHDPSHCKNSTYEVLELEYWGWGRRRLRGQGRTREDTRERPHTILGVYGAAKDGNAGRRSLPGALRFPRPQSHRRAVSAIGRVHYNYRT